MEVNSKLDYLKRYQEEADESQPDFTERILLYDPISGAPMEEAPVLDSKVAQKSIGKLKEQKKQKNRLQSEYLNEASDLEWTQE